MSLLNGFRVVQVGPGLAAAVCGRLLADVGADVGCIDPDASTPLAAYLDHGKPVVARDALATADLIVCEGRPAELRSQRWDADALRGVNATAALVFISPFGQTGPKADDPASDLTLMYSSGIARLLTGQVDDLAEAPIRPVGEQSAFIGGLAAACAGMHAAQPHMSGAIVDVSIEEALATMAMGELTGAGLHGRSRSRKRLTDGNGATVCILPARDGYTAISPREDRQWAAWLVAMGSPDWGSEPRFATKADRVANWDALHALMSAWSRRHDKQWIADTAQAARVPSFPLRELSEQLASAQLAHRGFWREIELGGRSVKAPRAPFGLSITRASHDCAAAAWAVAAVRRACARFQLGDRRADDDALSRGDGRRRDQGRGAWARRPRSRVGTAYRARSGEARHRARSEAAGGGRCRAIAGGTLRRAGGEFRHRRDGPVGARCGGIARAQSGADLRFGVGSGPDRSGIACRRLWHAAAMLRRVCRSEPASRRYRRASVSRGSIRCAG